jgi:SOS response regulatory protein OraA/RecX
MDKRKVIDYLTVKGFTKDKIIQVLNSNAMRSECEKIILEYEMKMAYNGYTKKEAINTLQSYQQIQNAAKVTAATTQKVKRIK